MKPLKDRTASDTVGSDPIIAEGDPDACDFATLAWRIQRALTRHGWIHVAHRLSVDAFDALASLLGPIELRSDIRIDPDLHLRQREQRVSNEVPRPSVYQPSALELHTDRPTAALIGWYCVAQDTEAGAILLTDTNDIEEVFSAQELDALGQVRVRCMVLDREKGAEIVHSAPLVCRRSRGWALYYVSWLVVPPDDAASRALLERFTDYVRHKEENNLFPLRLEPEQSLFVDNHRMLHGRGALPATSRRHLIRLYIQSNGEANDGW